MLRITAPTLAALLLATFASAAGAENLACQTVNGKTVCSRGGGTLSCQTVNDKTTCMTGPGVLTCETINGNTTCRRGAPQQDLKPLPMPPIQPQTQPIPDNPFGRNFPFEEEVRVRQDKHGLSVQVGALLVTID